MTTKEFKKWRTKVLLLLVLNIVVMAVAIRCPLAAQIIVSVEVITKVVASINGIRLLAPFVSDEED